MLTESKHDIDHSPQKVEVMGVPICLFDSYEHALECVGARIQKRMKTFCVAINPEKIYKAQRERQLFEMLNGADFQICDGIGASLAVRLLHRRSIQRVTGIALFLKLVEEAERKGWPIYLLGAAEESNFQAYNALRARFPRLKIAGRRNGYFEDEKSVIDEINNSGAQLLFVAMGSPRQEYWIAKNRELLNAPFCMGVGGTLDVVSGRVNWAPRFFRQTGTEWLYRLVSEPSRWRRQIVLPQFVYQIFKHMLLNPNR